MACAVLTGCPRDNPGPPPASTDERPDKTAALRKEAQQEALQRLAPLAASVAALEDPVTRALRDGTAPALPPWTPGARAALRDALEAAEREANGLTPRLLEPADRVLAITARFALSRARDTYLEKQPWRDDPTWVTTELDAVVSALEVASRREGSCAHCAAVLPQLAQGLSQVEPLRTASTATVAAAATDARALAQRLRALPADEATRNAAADAALAYATAIEQVSATAPARIGKDALVRRLEVEENVSTTPQDAFTRLGTVVATLSAMLAKRTAPEPTPATTVTTQRCEAAWADLRPILEGPQAPPMEGLSCASFVEGVGEATFDDAALRIALVDTLFVAGKRHQAQGALPPILSSVGGRLARGAQAHTLRSALLLSSPALEGVAAHALRAELDAACLAAAALWVHGELGDDEALNTRLGTYCPQETSAYIAGAEARPRQALHGLALARISMGPAGVVPLDRLWWLPAGLIDDVAMPPTDDAAPTGVQGTVEELKPQGAPPQ